MKAGFALSSTVTGGVWRLFLVAAALLLLFLGSLYWNLQRVNEIGEAVQRTEMIERELRVLGEDLLNAETGQRGFLLTREENYLEPYLAAKDLAPQRIDHLRTLIADPVARANLEKLAPIVGAKLQELAQTVELARAGQHAQALEIVHGGQGKELMDEFRQLRTNTVDRELQLLTEHRTRIIDEFHRVLLTVIIGGTLAICLLFLSAAHTAARLNKPITALMDGIQAMSGGQLGHRVQVISQDEVGRISAAFNDMATHLQRAHQARDAAHADLERSNAELDSFAYVASHDLKAPLRGIRNLAQWIGEDVEATASADTRENLRLLNTRVDRLDSLLESLLTYSRISRKTSAAEKVDTGALVGEIGDYLAPRPGFSIACRGEMPTLMTAKAPLEQVLRNLINNALKHHDGERGSVEVSAQDLGDTVEFRVDDDGPGIPPEFHERVFMMFQTLKPRDEVEGSGMGLAIVKKTVENWGGQIRIDNSRFPRGAAFVFSWPKDCTAAPARDDLRPVADQVC